MKSWFFIFALLLIPVAAFSADSKPKVKVTVTMEDKSPVVSLAPEKDPGAVVVELFTSQGCSSCPSAQEYLLDLSRHSDILTLEYHVDYWDGLKTWTGGNWKDPFSNAEWTQRQVTYNSLISNEEDKAYTPEMVVDGQFQSSGNAKSNVSGIIADARAQHRQKYILSSAVSDDGKMTVSVEGPRLKDAADVVLLRLQKEADTQVKGGENKGATIHGHNIVKELMVIGTWDGGKGHYKFNLPKFAMGEETCAVLLQDPETKHIYAGGICAM